MNLPVSSQLNKHYYLPMLKVSLLLKAANVFEVFCKHRGLQRCFEKIVLLKFGKIQRKKPVSDFLF